MASRSSTSIGVGVTIGILSVAALAFFITAVVFFGKARQAQRDLETQQSTLADFVKPDERNRDDVRVLIDEAKKSRQSLVSYLVDSYQTAMEKTVGNRRQTAAGFQERLGKIAGADTAALVQVIDQRERRIADLENQLAKSESDRKTALADLQNEVDRVKGIDTRHNETVASLNGQVGTYRTEVDQYRDGINAAQAKMSEAVGKLRQQLADTESDGQRRLNKLQEENLIAQNQLQALRGEKKNQVLRAPDEASLVDSQVVAIDGAARQVSIGLGSSQHVVLGMTFSVYSDASALKVDAAGNYPMGKAGLEVISVGPDSSACRILWEVRGSPVVPGDVIANPVYDPTKVYKFLAYGNFDLNADGIATPSERDLLQGLIESWGGKVVDDLSGDADFLILGERPILPPRPSPDTPIEVMQEYIRLDRGAQRYDTLRKQAEATSLPILNQNRLFTLLGRSRGTLPTP
jgi:hypothetical protein